MMSTFKSFFYLQDWQVISGFILFYAAISLSIYWVCFFSGLKERLKSFHGVVAPYILVPMSIFALSSALLGVSVWDHFQNNAKAIGAEAQAIEAYITLVQSIPLEGKKALIDDAKVYARSALNEEWEMIAMQRHAHQGTSICLQKLIRDTVSLAIENKLPTFLQSAVLQAAQNINNARNARLSMINDEPDTIRWLSIILLGVMVLVSVAMVHLDRPKPMLATLAVSTASICIVLSLVGLAVNPFSGMLMISKAPLEQILIDE
jgi:hypothetical protein